jgi:hypothetical protein
VPPEAKRSDMLISTPSRSQVARMSTSAALMLIALDICFLRQLFVMEQAPTDGEPPAGATP